jgi:uncharacterized protein (TIGR02145 family)
MLNQQFGNYKFLSVLGEGGMAIVYLAENTMLGSLVAIKVLKEDFVSNKNVRSRFLDEAKKMVKVKHPNIIQVYDLIDAGDIVAIVMEYIEGQSLKDLIENQGKMSQIEIERLFPQILLALQHVHKAGFVHRDIKPSNFMLSTDGAIKLADFGIAKDKNVAAFTETGTQMGTPMYMSPEQIKSTRDVDHLSDIYSLGVVLYELVTGSFPFDKNKLTLPEIQVCILRDPLPKTGSLWDTQIAKATAKNEIDRYQSCNDWLDLINDFGKGYKVESDLDLNIDQKEELLIDERNYSLLRKVIIFILLAFFILLVIFFFKSKNEKDDLVVNSDRKTNSELESIDSIETFLDQFGNKFQGKKIVNQIWMIENLNVVQFRNGDTILEAKTVEEWKMAGKTGRAAWCNIEKKGFSKNNIGKLYNWYAVNDPRGLAPKGWHVPSEVEWVELENSLGENVGLKLKSTYGWANEFNGTNESLLSFYPEGKRDFTGLFLGFSLNGYWWSSTETETKRAWCFILNHKNNNFEKALTAESNGFSVRCVKDNGL